MADTRKHLKIGVVGNKDAKADFLTAVREKTGSIDRSHITGVDYIPFDIRDDVRLSVTDISSRYVQFSQAQFKNCDIVIYFEDTLLPLDSIPVKKEKVRLYDNKKGAIAFLEDVVNEVYPATKHDTATSKTEETVAPTKREENVQTKQEVKVVPAKETVVAPKKSEGSILGGVSKFFSSIIPPSQPNKNPPTVTKVKPFSIND